MRCSVRGMFRWMRSVVPHNVQFDVRVHPFEESFITLTSTAASHHLANNPGHSRRPVPSSCRLSLLTKHWRLTPLLPPLLSTVFSYLLSEVYSAESCFSRIADLNIILILHCKHTRIALWCNNIILYNTYYTISIILLSITYQCLDRALFVYFQLFNQPNKRWAFCKCLDIVILTLFLSRHCRVVPSLYLSTLHTHIPFYDGLRFTARPLVSWREK